MADSPEAIKKSIRLYIYIGSILFMGTILTYLVATVPALDVGKHGFDTWDMVLGLSIATVKASLVAMIFMHLNHEKSMIYWLFGLGLFMGVAMAALIFLSDGDPLHYAGFAHGVFVPGNPVQR
jgi:caa(3)-type oxidase subunit IV